jgi:molybdopterin converting factor small subunit
MKITLKLYSLLSDHLPADAHRNQVDMDFPDGSSIGDILRQISLPVENCHLILVNGTYHAPADVDDMKDLKDGDVLAMWPPVAGG